MQNATDLEAVETAAAEAHAQTAVPASPVGSAGPRKTFAIYSPAPGGQQVPQQQATVEALHAQLACFAAMLERMGRESEDLKVKIRKLEEEAKDQKPETDPWQPGQATGATDPWRVGRLAAPPGVGGLAAAPPCVGGLAESQPGSHQGSYEPLRRPDRKDLDKPTKIRRQRRPLAALGRGSSGATSHAGTTSSSKSRPCAASPSPRRTRPSGLRSSGTGPSFNGKTT